MLGGVGLCLPVDGVGAAAFVGPHRRRFVGLRASLHQGTFTGGIHI